MVKSRTIELQFKMIKVLIKHNNYVLAIHYSLPHAGVTESLRSNYANITITLHPICSMNVYNLFLYIIIKRISCHKCFESFLIQ